MQILRNFQLRFFLIVQFLHRQPASPIRKRRTLAVIEGRQRDKNVVVRFRLATEAAFTVVLEQDEASQAFCILRGPHESLEIHLLADQCGNARLQFAMSVDSHKALFRDILWKVDSLKSIGDFCGIRMSHFCGSEGKTGNRQHQSHRGDARSFDKPRGRSNPRDRGNADENSEEGHVEPENPDKTRQAQQAEAKCNRSPRRHRHVVKVCSVRRFSPCAGQWGSGSILSDGGVIRECGCAGVRNFVRRAIVFQRAIKRLFSHLSVLRALLLFHTQFTENRGRS